MGHESETESLAGDATGTTGHDASEVSTVDQIEAEMLRRKRSFMYSARRRPGSELHHEQRDSVSLVRTPAFSDTAARFFKHNKAMGVDTAWFVRQGVVRLDTEVHTEYLAKPRR